MLLLFHGCWIGLDWIGMDWIGLFGPGGVSGGCRMDELVIVKRGVRAT